MAFEEDIKKWEKEKQLYCDLAAYLRTHLKDIFDAQGLPVNISVRPKDDFSLMKKLNKKQHENPDYTYEEMSDKCGARIICRVKDEVPVACKIIDDSFEVKNTDNKYEGHKFNEQGYKGIHKDAQLKCFSEENERFRNLLFEIQIRTLCDNVWADIYHDIGYKPENIVDNAINRQLHCLAGLLEVGDNEISQISINIKNSKQMTPEFVLSCLEKPYIELFRLHYNPDYSLSNLKFFIPLLKIDSTEKFKQTITDFVNKNEEKILHIRAERANELIKYPLSTQPEILLIFYLIETDSFLLKSKWNDAFPPLYLEELSTWWGKSISTKI